MKLLENLLFLLLFCLTFNIWQHIFYWQRLIQHNEPLDNLLWLYFFERSGTDNFTHLCMTSLELIFKTDRYWTLVLFSLFFFFFFLMLWKDFFINFSLVIFESRTNGSIITAIHRCRQFDILMILKIINKQQNTKSPENLSFAIDSIFLLET